MAPVTLNFCTRWKCECSTSRFGRFTPLGRNFGTQWRGGMAGPKAGLEKRKCPPTGVRTLMHQIRSNNTDYDTSGCEQLRLWCTCSAYVWQNYGKQKNVTRFSGVRLGIKRGYFANKNKSTVSSENQTFRLLNVPTRSQQNTSNVVCFFSASCNVWPHAEGTK